MNLKELQGKLVAVLGFGLEGQAITRYLLKHGIKPVLFDEKIWDKWDKDRQSLIKSLDINFIFGPDCYKELAGFDIIFRSPGIPLSKVKGQRSDVVITSQTKWFFEHCPCKIIGVTGTKGKGTTSTLISEILKLQFRISNFEFQVYLTGNIGKEQPLDFLDNLTKDDWVVYELSSFQLQDLDRSPHIGVVLMVTQEHLDYHKDVEEYCQAKESIVKFQSVEDYSVINMDYESSVKIGNNGAGQKRYFSARGKSGVDCYVKDGAFYLKNNGSSPDEPFVEAKDLQLRGEHNWENVCAAATAAISAGCSLDTVKTGALAFKGLEHRLEFVDEKNGVKYYNDSFSTTPETAIAAIKSFSEPEIVILGGSSKNSDFTELGKTIVESKNIKCLVLIGLESGRILDAINSSGKIEAQILQGAESMQEIFGQIASVAKAGDVVLLSPACASFGMFKNYKDRGEQFKFFVEKFKN